jgi:hypothetical protein
MKQKKRPITLRLDGDVVDPIDDSQPNTKSSEELELLKRVIEESKVFRRPASRKGQQPAKVKRGAQKRDQQGRRGAV